MADQNAFVQYINEDKFFTDLFNHAHHMSVASGYKANYLVNGQRVSDKPLVVRHTFWDSENRAKTFDMYEGERLNLEAGMGKAMRTVQFVVPPGVMEKHPHVKEDLGLLCGRVFGQDPKWVSVEDLPMPVPKEKPGCLGYWFNRFVGDF